ncbi:ABC transporter ATP-binding protein/permease [Bosea sp. PAMC 26642]|uniref:ABC transporter ATP-binding protein/permease n=1 Tax=Bosea sp. (strain PAMC 26642) TaxID=1792307 RepID=UPI00076FF961|nr:ABC transporter ATP-binding protein/permease [Bosea sp. PAMC 26642]AMJ59086.1 ABC transporter [Bosea sp. PAMC 26642]
MRPLSFAIAALAVLALIVGQQTGSAGTIGMGVVGILLAAAIFRSTEIPYFLKIFSGIFGTEYVVFGGLALLAQLGYWPQDWQAAALPTSLPTTVAVFGVLIYVISFVPVVQRIARISSPYFLSQEPTVADLWLLGRYKVKLGHLAVALIVFIIVLNQAQVGVSLRINFFYRDFNNALQEKNAAAFWEQLIYVFSVWAAISAISNLIEIVAQSVLLIRWREWMAAEYSKRWLGDGTHYRISLAGTADNPDQRISEDTRSFLNQTYSFSLTMLTQVSTLVSFSIILWNIPVAIPIPGTDIIVPGFLFWATLIYAAVATWITHLIGKPLIALDFEQERREANFRFSLARLREYSEQIALMRGEPAEQQHLGRRFAAIVENFYQLMWRKLKLTTFTLSYNQANVVIPYVLLAPYYFAGAISFGVLSQVASAFGRVETAMSFFINSYQSIASYLASINRLTTFEAAIAQAQAASAGEAGIHHAAATDTSMHIGGTTLALPNGAPIVRIQDLDLGGARRTLLVGPSGSGKSTLFRAIAGIWPFGEGKVGIPAGADIMLLPQRPYLPQGSLRAAISYPSEEAVFADADIRAAMQKVNLGHLADRLDDVDLWGQRLSGGEQQRLAVARALLAKPDWLFLDEATASLDEKLEGEIYATIDKEMPDTRIVSIGHRSTLREMHDAIVRMEPNEDGTFSPKAVQRDVPVQG